MSIEKYDWAFDNGEFVLSNKEYFSRGITPEDYRAYVNTEKYCADVTLADSPISDDLPYLTERPTPEQILEHKERRSGSKMQF